jgi:hypothetical protein
MTDFPRLRSDILFHNLDDEVLAYDGRNDRIHLLDPTTARVLDLLRSEKNLGEADIGLELIELALDELRKAELLEESASHAEVLDPQRRELLRKAVVGAAAVLIPAIVTLSPGTAQGQAGSCLPKKACCVVDADCCSNKCDPSTTTGCTTGPLECH